MRIDVSAWSRSRTSAVLSGRFWARSNATLRAWRRYGRSCAGVISVQNVLSVRGGSWSSTALRSRLRKNEDNLARRMSSAS